MTMLAIYSCGLVYDLLIEALMMSLPFYLGATGINAWHVSWQLFVCYYIVESQVAMQEKIFISKL